MPYFPILQKPTQNNLITKTSFRQDAPSPSEKNRRREDCPIVAIHRHRRKNRRRAVSYVSTGLACLPRDTNASRIYRRRAVVEGRGEQKKDRWLGFQPSVSVSLRSAVRLLVDNTTLFDTSLLACKVAQIVQFCTTHFTKLVDCDAVDKR